MFSIHSALLRGVSRWLCWAQSLLSFQILNVRFSAWTVFLKSVGMVVDCFQDWLGCRILNAWFFWNFFEIFVLWSWASPLKSLFHHLFLFRGFRFSASRGLISSCQRIFHVWWVMTLFIISFKGWLIFWLL